MKVSFKDLYTQGIIGSESLSRPFLKSRVQLLPLDATQALLACRKFSNFSSLALDCAENIL